LQHTCFEGNFLSYISDTTPIRKYYTHCKDFKKHVSVWAPESLLRLKTPRAEASDEHGIKHRDYYYKMWSKHGKRKERTG
jgi:hypothetical protein